jgi:hypothetical protein
MLLLNIIGAAGVVVMCAACGSDVHARSGFVTDYGPTLDAGVPLREPPLPSPPQSD